ncbi:TPA: hypothetical protein DEP34_00575 [Candidatus Uhrbacteria bacterium]|uniref:Anaerobic ribonucleoside-triphosphate reductase-activating protein n=2 Tax=Candidatus Uhriibacteriota TaxID=1752732 RepID=A0A0G1Q896_9BACT|nr:MAG: Anaerobic ribonucleoside-triphosphate reductase-activating protein [Candidatus Uhrbacteria bacterium GW2011_GWF2_46_218]KKU41209.1 MAG: Anaerobic ribonucleoside-triphosphate reductase-activating protein [Candidatus Uhrbacteria bacterium GW2011_GWE2_46_68]HBK34057.1 hypothetical protein [Candidatus Uhrbacteria bacterium]HCB18865.1 hypothetical protein [Candidatus Uhrbacteria bacterium]
MGKKTINLGHFEPATRAMGPGLRACLWVRGCRIRCPGCISPFYLDQDPKADIALWRMLQKIRKAKEEYGIEGISISGGEPFDQAIVLSELCEAVHILGLSTLAWSGYTRRRLEGRRASRGTQNLLQHIDVLIDGPFQIRHHTEGLPLRGSGNQRIHLLTDRYCMDDLSGSHLEVRMHENRAVQITGVTDYSKALAILNLMGLDGHTAMSR